MIETIKNIILLILLIYSVAISTLFWFYYNNLSVYQKDKDNLLEAKEKELQNRESIVVDKEICFRELTKLKTIQNTALDVLKSYSLVTPAQLKTEMETVNNNVTNP